MRPGPPYRAAPVRSIGFLLVAVATACASSPAPAQSLYIDVNGDGRGDASDVLSPAVTSVDIYLDTTHDATGALAACSVKEPLSISSYTFILEWDPGRNGTLSYGAWSDNMGFTVRAGGAQAGRMFWIGRAAPYYLVPGRHVLGSLEVKVTGTPILRFLSSTPHDFTALTSFGSECYGRDFDHTIKLGSEFVDASGTSLEDPSPRTVWRTVRDLYR